MDTDLLENASELIVKGLLSQDLTMYYELLGHDVTLNVLFDRSTLPLPSDAARAKGDASASEEEALHKAPANDQGASEGTVIPPGIVSDALSVHVGPAAFAQATFDLYKWLQSAKHVFQPRVLMEPRRPRKEATATTASSAAQQKGPGSPRGKQGASAAAPPSFKSPAPGNQAERAVKLQAFSKLTVMWGRPGLQLRDDIYFDEGVISIVDRSAIQPEDPTAQQYLADRAALFGETTRRTDTRSSHPPVLDYTFSPINEVIDLLRIPPTHGRLHKIRGVEQVVVKAEPTKHSAALYQLPGQTNAPATGKGGSSSKTLIKAKNKKGEEEAYEFKDEDRAARQIKAEKEQKDDIVARLAEMLSGKYEAEAFRISNNPNIKDVTQLVPVLKNLVANGFLTIAWLDLSCNAISTLPNDLVTLPLTSFYLHGNMVRDWAEIDRVVCAMPHLHSFTCHGNPIAQEPHYKNLLLTKLMTAKARVVPLKQLDFVALSTQDVVVGAIHEAFTAKKKRSAREPAESLMMTFAKSAIAMKSPRGLTPRGASLSEARNVSVSPRR